MDKPAVVDVRFEIDNFLRDQLARVGKEDNGPVVLQILYDLVRPETIVSLTAWVNVFATLVNLIRSDMALLQKQLAVIQIATYLNTR